jgi:hypothetical protein
MTIELVVHPEYFERLSSQCAVMEGAPLLQSLAGMRVRQSAAVDPETSIVIESIWGRKRIYKLSEYLEMQGGETCQ